MPESPAQLRAGWAKEKARKDYLALPKTPRSMDTAPGFSGKLGQAVAARNKREFMQDARSQQARRAEQLMGADLQQQQQEAVAGTQFGLQRQRGKQTLRQQKQAGEQRLAEIGTKGQQTIRQQQGKAALLPRKAKGTPGAASVKQKADITSRLREQYYGKDFGQRLQDQYGEKELAERGQSGFPLFLREEMQKYQPAQLPQPTQTMGQPDILQELPQTGGVRSFTSSGTQAQTVPSFGQQPIQSVQPSAVAPSPQVQPAADLPKSLNWGDPEAYKKGRKRRERYRKTVDSPYPYGA